MKTKEYTFKEGFTIKPRSIPDGIVFAMGETHICESNVFDLYQNQEFIKTYETFAQAKKNGIKLTEALQYLTTNKL